MLNPTNRTTALLALAALLVAAQAIAGTPRKIDVPAGQLTTALKALAAQSGVEFVYSTDQLEGLRTNGVHGELTAEKAVAKLLEGTNLKVTVHESGALLIAPASGPAISGALTRVEPGLRVAQSGAEDVKTAGASAGQQSESSDPTIQEVIVTAQKRAERLIDAPQSVTVVGADDIARLGAVQFRDFANTVPGLSFNTGGTGYNQIVLRGVTTGIDPSPTVGVYVDEVPYGSSTGFARGGQLAFDAGLFDMDRIEVLRGPQGTLYGASTMGGLIKYVSRAPDAAKFGGNTQAGLSSTEEGGINYNVAGAVNAPLVADKVALRASGYYSHDDGYVDNLTLGKEDVDSSRTYGGRLDLLFAPTEAFSVRLTGFAQKIDRDGYPLGDFRQAGGAVDGELEQRRDWDEFFGQRFQLGSATVTYDFGSATLTAISGYQTVRTHIFEDYPVLKPVVQALNPPLGAVALEIHTDTDKFTQEVRLASERRGPIEWLVGAFYNRETSEDLSETPLRDPAGQSVPNTLITLISASRYEEYAGFGDLTWHFTGKFDVTGGVRYAQNRQSRVQFGSGSLGLDAPEGSSTENVFTYLANLRYHFTEDSTGYVRYATGYRPGGPNFSVRDPFTGGLTASDPFDSDRLRSYEAGYKAQTRDRRFGIDGAVYYIDWSNIQALINRNGFGYLINAPGGATVKGAEAKLSLRPLSSVLVTVGGVYQDARLNEATPSLGARKDERLPNVPRYTANLTADYELPIGDQRPVIGATVRQSGDRWTTFGTAATSPRPQFHLPDYTVVDLRGAMTFGRVDFQLSIHNLLNERAQIATPTISVFPRTGPIGISTLQPRTYGVMLSTQF